MIGNRFRFKLGSIPLPGWRKVGPAFRSAILMLIVALLATSPLPVSAATPDPVLEWIGVMNTTVLKAGTAPNVTGRVVALVSASVFDAVNGIEPRFRPLHVRPDAPHNASQSAAAIQAAYVILMNLYGTQQGAALTSQHDASLAALASTEKPQSIAAGVAWGQSVADAIWAWRLTDGFAPTPPPFFGVQSIAGNTEFRGLLAPDATGQRIRRNTATCHHDTVCTDATVAVPRAAAIGLEQPRVHRRLKRSETDGQPD